MAIGYDVENHVFTIYGNGVLLYTYDVETAHPGLELPASNGFFFCAGGAPITSLTINATPTYEIPGYSYI